MVHAVNSENGDHKISPLEQGSWWKAALLNQYLNRSPLHSKSWVKLVPRSSRKWEFRKIQIFESKWVWMFLNWDWTMGLKCPNLVLVPGWGGFPGFRANFGLVFSFGQVLTYFFSDKGKVREAVEHAISKGYRNVDAAWIYGNEGEVGEAIEAKINDGTVKREDLFIATKERLHNLEFEVGTIWGWF